MLFGVVGNEDGRDVGIDRDGTRQQDHNKIELMNLAEAESTAAQFGGIVRSDLDLYPEDFDEFEDD